MIMIPEPPSARESGQPAHPRPGLQPRPRRRGLLEPERAVVALVLPLPAAQGTFTYDVRTVLGRGVIIPLPDSIPEWDLEQFSRSTAAISIPTHLPG